MEKETQKNPLSQFTPAKIALPILIGVVVSVLLLYNFSKFNSSRLSAIVFTKQVVAGLCLALLTVIIRDLAYMYRIWLLANRQIPFIRCVEVILLWEFGSAITPASVGGATLAVFILNKEKLSLGKSTSIILMASYLDNIAFILAFSVLYFLLGNKMFLLAENCSDLQSMGILQSLRGLAAYAWIGFLIIAFTGSMLGFSIFVKPQWAKALSKRMAKWSFLHRWSEKILFFGDEIWLTSQEFKNRERSFFIKVLLATLVSWTARYALANALIWGFSQTDVNQLVVFSRQYVHRILTMIPLTPGGSGLMEATFVALNCDFLPSGLSDKVAIIWRIYNFYIYLLIGMVVFPRWLKRISK